MVPMSPSPKGTASILERAHTLLSEIIPLAHTGPERAFDIQISSVQTSPAPSAGMCARLPLFNQ